MEKSKQEQFLSAYCIQFNEQKYKDFINCKEIFHLNKNNLKIQCILLDPFVTLLYHITSKCDNHKSEYDLEDILLTLEINFI